MTPPRRPRLRLNHLATGLGVIAAQHGHRVLFATDVDWVARLTDAHRHSKLRTELATSTRRGGFTW
jgi:DNA replication protein DnaC